MRTLIIVLIAGLLFSNIANAAQICCWSMENSHMSDTNSCTTASGDDSFKNQHIHSSDHQQNDHDQNNPANQVLNDHQCECEGCMPMVELLKILPIQHEFASTLHNEPSQLFTSAIPTRTAPPPKANA